MILFRPVPRWILLAGWMVGRLGHAQPLSPLPAPTLAGEPEIRTREEFMNLPALKEESRQNLEGGPELLMGYLQLEDVPEFIRIGATTRTPEERVMFLQPMYFQMKDNAKLTSPILLTLLKDGNPNVRFVVVHLLDTFNIREAVNALKPLVHDRDPGVRSRTFLALRRFGIDAVPPLREQLTHPDPGFRRWALWGLKESGDPRAIPAVKKLLDDKDPSIPPAARETLEALGEVELPRLKRKGR